MQFAKAKGAHVTAMASGANVHATVLPLAEVRQALALLKAGRTRSKVVWQVGP